MGKRLLMSVMRSLVTHFSNDLEEADKCFGISAVLVLFWDLGGVY